MSDVTRILDRVQRGEPKAADELLPLVYEELRRLASWRMARESPGHTLQATALVHEAYLRLIGQEEQPWQNSRHFFSAAAEAMRRILVERARQKARRKYGGDWQRVNLGEVNVATESNDETLLFVSDALEKLAVKDPVCAELIKLRFFAGDIALKKGVNLLVFKVVNGVFDWKGSIRFTDAQGNPVKGIKVTLDPEEKDLQRSFE